MRGILDSSQIFRWLHVQLHVAPEGLAVTKQRGFSPSMELGAVASYTEVIAAEVIEQHRSLLWAPIWWPLTRLGLLARHSATLLVKFLDGKPAWEFTQVAPAEAYWASELILTQVALLHRARTEEFRAAVPFADLQSRAERTLQSHERAAVDFVDFVLFQAVFHRASDVHFESTGDGMAVRFRVQGHLRDALRLPLPWRERVINRLKVSAQLSALRVDVPQEGRLSLDLGDRRVDLRLASLPTLHGERLVVRVFDPATGLLMLDQLGMSDEVRQRLERVLAEPQGLVLLTGPAGSGKTTTLYAALRWLHAQSQGARSLATVEDPIEFDLGLGNQTQVNPAVGLTFAAGLRSVLRQDPQIIMLGEIRDAETAEIVARAGLTGHLLLSTLHARTPSDAFVRLLDLGVEPYLVASTVSAVLTQRLVRTVCNTCSGKGCEACNSSGFNGRTGVFELILADDAMRALVMQRASAGEFTAAAAAQGLPTLRDDGQARVAAGVTTLDELQRVGV